MSLDPDDRNTSDAALYVSRAAERLAAHADTPLGDEAAHVPSEATKRAAPTAPAYPMSSLVALNDGCVLDLRVNFAMQLLCAPGFACDGPVQSVAHRALKIADSLLEQAAEKGWVNSLPLTADLPLVEVAHVKRNGVAQVISQMAAGEYAQAVAGRIATFNSAN